MQAHLNVFLYEYLCFGNISAGLGIVLILHNFGLPISLQLLCIPFDFMKHLNSFEVKLVPLLLTKTFKIPNCEHFPYMKFLIGKIN